MWPLRWLACEVPDTDGACADFVRRVLREEFGTELPLPSPASGIRGRDAQIAAVAADVAEPAADPRDGDIVTMRCRGRRYGSGHHIGVRCTMLGRPHVLHATRSHGVRLDNLADTWALASCGLELTGVYRLLNAASRGA